MTTFRKGRGPVHGPRAASPASPRHSVGARVRRSPLALVRDTGVHEGPVELRTLTRQPMPADVRGALVTSVQSVPGGILRVVWVTAMNAAPIAPGEILLSWEPVGGGLMDVTARLGLASGPVLLAVWPGLRGNWSDTVRPTVAEVRELHAALRLATVVLDRLADRPCVCRPCAHDPLG